MDLVFMITSVFEPAASLRDAGRAALQRWSRLGKSRLRFLLANRRCERYNSGVEFRILGPLEVADGGGPIAFDAPKQRTLLGVLLLHPNEVVSTGRLIDELWGERPPATAAKIVQNYVSQLRKALGPDLIATRPPGYLLRIEDDGLDAGRFRRLATKGRRLAANGEQKQAQALLREALALWRGPPLADVAFESFARSEVERLEEERLATLTDRIDCDLALGRHDELVSELESLVKQHPLRERLRAQLMLALYRSGRQADALAAYRDARRTLVDELGLEPGPELHELERSILQHDSAVEPPSAATPARARGEARLRRHVRSGWLLFATAGLGLAIALTAAGSLGLPDASTQPSKPITLVGNSVAIVDSATNAVVGEIPVGGRPGGIAVGAGSVWVGNQEDNALLRIDPRSRRVVRTIELGALPLDVTVQAGAVWVLTAAGSVLRVDPETSKVVKRIPLGEVFISYASHLARAGAMVYVANDALSRIDPANNAVTMIRKNGVVMITADQNTLWVLSRAADGGVNAIERIAPNQAKVLTRFRLNHLRHDLDGIAVGRGAVWTAEYAETTLFKVDPATGHVTGSVLLGSSSVGGILFGEGAMWVLGRDETILRVDPRKNRVVRKIHLGIPAGGTAASESGRWAIGEGAVWALTGRP